LNERTPARGPRPVSAVLCWTLDYSACSFLEGVSRQHRMTTPRVTTYTIEACNLSHASENKVHDDQIAQALGFSGGLVAGVEVYAYACHPVVRHWGRDWLARGRMECRFLKPVYDGRLALVKAADSQGALEVTLESEGVLCATAHATLDASAAV